jgi:hypothetical protein
VKIRIESDEAKTLLKRLMERYLPEIQIENISYSDWDGFDIEGTARCTIKPEYQEPPPPPPAPVPRRVTDDDGFDIPF